MSKEKVIEMGNAKVIVSEENGVVSVKIEGSSPIIYLNDEVIFSVGNDKEEFKRIPPQLHPFLLKCGSDYLEYDEKNKNTTVDFSLEKSNLTMYIPSNRNKKIIVRYDFIDELAAKDYILESFEEDEAKKLIKELEEKTLEFKSFIESFGWTYAFSHRVGEWAYAWADVNFKIDQWNEETMIEISKKIREFEKYTNSLYDKIHNF